MGITNFDSITVGGNLVVGSSATSPSSPALGQSYYDTATGKVMFYQANGWTNVDGSAAGSLNAAYDGGQTITVDGGQTAI